jgi:DinB superfamily
MLRGDIAEDLKFLSKTPDRIALLVAGLGDDLVRTRTADDQFSVLENICHLRDIEIEGYEKRINRILGEDRPSLPDINGAQLAMERNYNNEDLSAALQSFSDARARNVATVSNLTEMQLNRQGELEGTGLVSLNKLLLMLREHDEGHLEELEVLKKRLLPNQTW